LELEEKSPPFNFFSEKTAQNRKIRHFVNARLNPQNQSADEYLGGSSDFGSSPSDPLP